MTAFGAEVKWEEVKTHHHHKLAEIFNIEKSLNINCTKIIEIEMRRVKAAWEQFIGPTKAQKMTMKRVVMIHNPLLEKRFFKKHQHLNERIVKNNESWRTRDESEPDNKQMREMTHNHMLEYLKRMNGGEKREENDGVKMVMTCWKQSESQCLSVAESNFTQLQRHDEGRFGDGFYFSSHQQQAMNEDEGVVLMSWVMLGRVFPLIEEMKGQHCAEGFDSHFVIVNKKSGEVWKKGDREEEKREDIVVFDCDHILPRFIVHYAINNH